MRTKGPPETHNKHKRAFPDQVRQVVRISDIVLETLDARYIKESRIPELEAMVAENGKILIHVIMKSDLVKSFDDSVLETLSNPILVSTKTREGISRLRKTVHILSKKFNQYSQIHIGVVGYPNTGKSSLINALARRSAAPTSSHAGHTKHIRWIRFARGIQLLDAPGIVNTDESIFVGQEDLKKHAMMGVHVPETVRNPELIVAEIMKKNPKQLEDKYDLRVNGDTELLINTLGEKWRMLKKKGQIDSDRVSRRILKEWNKK